VETRQTKQTRQTKRHKVHLLIISETGRVKSRKISLRFIKWLGGILAVLFVLTSVFTYLYVRDFVARRSVKRASESLLKEADRFRNKTEEQAMEIKRLQGVIERLKRENQDLKQHIISRKGITKKEESPPVTPPPSKDFEAYQKFLAQIEGMDVTTPANFHIRDPKIEVSQKETVVSFKLYKDTLKKMTGRFILVGIYKPEEKGVPGKVVAFPRRGVVSFRIRPVYGRYFRIEKQFLPVEAKLPHPEGVSRFSEFHIFVYGLKKKLLFHEQFKAP